MTGTTSARGLTKKSTQIFQCETCTWHALIMLSFVPPVQGGTPGSEKHALQYYPFL